MKLLSLDPGIHQFVLKGPRSGAQNVIRESLADTMHARKPAVPRYI